jgi:hypothetical protein
VFFADLAFVSDLLFFFQRLFAVKTPDLLEPPKPAVASTTGQRQFSAEQFTIGEISMAVFTRGNTERSPIYPQTVRFLSLIPDITNGTIALPAFAFSDCTMTQSYVQTEIVKPLIQSLTREAFKLLLRIDLFRPATGTRSGNFARRIERLRGGEITVLGRMGGSALLGVGDSVLGGVSRVLHAVSFDRGTEVARVNATAAETAKAGATAFGQGFLRGITGIVMDPINMAKERGAIGAFMGIGKGIVGLVTKPVCGILDGGAGAMAALRKVINGEDADVIPPMRIARAFPREQIRVLTDDEGGTRVAASVRFIDSAQFAIQMSGERRARQGIELFHRDRPARGLKWFAFTEKKMFVLDTEPKIVRTIRLREVSGVSIRGAIVMVRVRKGDPVEFIVLDEMEAAHLSDWIVTRAQLLVAGEK